MKYFAVGEDYCAVIQKDFPPGLTKDKSTLRCLMTSETP